ncbi:E3 ubiquitin-protein ligase RNF181-like [Anneissia japonica]|uniref:E3 ubiquitin-protein ligase RNF181-like n=1 Tax=Anneissia japonica TaxID=1529436 RepID=UPI00142573CB|nr:E3 ubiquitin-protein ligase RNF181-like [Anneissia japonica]XP_033108269.1 E3 ubiquitin-protein ligase RNF181-like [Anneissia japonica]
MASYFDEHNCQPTGNNGPEPETLLNWARVIMANVREFAERYEGIPFPWELEMKAPPASKKIVENLEKVKIETIGTKCPVCLLPFESGENASMLPCQHRFHGNCIQPWLSQTNSCPVCRYELPTDDEKYEEYKKDKVCT